MTMNQKKALYAFGCPDREATVNRFCTLAELAPRYAPGLDLALAAHRRVGEDAVAVLRVRRAAATG